MALTKKTRQAVYDKYQGKCAYSGTPLEPDWQVDHIKTRIMYEIGSYPYEGDPDDIDNLVPCQKILNHYKRALPLEAFRTWFLGGLHKRLRTLPKNPKTEKSQKRKDYLLRVANYFGITEDKPFSGKFYFETLNKDII